MHYILLFRESAEDFAKRNDPAEAGAYWGAWSAYVDQVDAAGIKLGGAGLEPPETATTLRVRDGRRVLHDGPYAETKEMLGGFFLINVPNLDVALDWAARSPAASYGSVEVRPAILPPREG